MLYVNYLKPSFPDGNVLNNDDGGKGKKRKVKEFLLLNQLSTKKASGSPDVVTDSMVVDY